MPRIMRAISGESVKLLRHPPLPVRYITGERMRRLNEAANCQAEILEESGTDYKPIELESHEDFAAKLSRRNT